MRPGRLLFLILLLLSMLAVAEDISKYPLRVQLTDVKHDVHESQAGTVMVGRSMPIPSEVRTDGTAMVFADQASAEKASKEPGPQYKLVCEADVGLAAGMYNARWEKKDARLTILAPQAGKPDKFTKVVCKASPLK